MFSFCLYWTFYELLHSTLFSRTLQLFKLHYLLFKLKLFIFIFKYFLGPVCAVEINLLYAPQIGEKQPDDIVKYYLESLLELMVNQVIIIII